MYEFLLNFDISAAIYIEVLFYFGYMDDLQSLAYHVLRVQNENFVFLLILASSGCDRLIPANHANSKADIWSSA